ncbi:sensor histidine kinase [Phreatobacter stygius]|nr:PAS domain S-box protein [Phreatobacter stygius]
MAQTRAQLDYRALLASIVDSTDDAIVSKDLDGIITSWNPAAERIFGFSADEIIGEPITRLIPPDRHAEERVILDTIRAGKRVETFTSIRRRKSGEDVHVSVTISPIVNSQGVVIGASKIARDISARRRSEEIRDMLMREVAHRSKNMLAIVEAIVRQTIRRSSSEDFAKELSGRLQSMAASQDLLVNGNWAGVEIRALAKRQLEHVDGAEAPRIDLDGPPLMLSPNGAQALGMALHELSTNALKFGALSNDRGTVHLQWAVTGEPQQFVLTWREAGGPPVSQPAHYGFGHSVLVRMTEATLHAAVTMIYAPRGLHWSLEAPVTSILSR